MVIYWCINLFSTNNTAPVAKPSALAKFKKKRYDKVDGTSLYKM